MLPIRLGLWLSLILASQAVFAQKTWHYDMLLNSKIIGEQSLRQIDNKQGSMLVQTTKVEKKGWFSSFEMHGISVEQLNPKGNTQAIQTRVTADNRTWWSQLSTDEYGASGSGRDLGELGEPLKKKLAALDKKILSSDPLAMAEIQSLTEELLDNAGTQESSQPQASLDPEARFVTSLNALPFYLKRAGRIPGSLQLIDNEGLQVINSPIVDLGTQSMEIGGAHYIARHIKVAKADAGTHIWFNEGDEGPVVLMIAGKSGKKKFQISLKEEQSASD
ncbi:MAG: hypothetical protein ACPGSC_00155 [Granulosicoccaceae bacterium]